MLNYNELTFFLAFPCLLFIRASHFSDLVNHSPPPLWTLLTIPPPYACIIFDNHFCIKYAFQKCQQLSGFSFSRVRVFGLFCIGLFFRSFSYFSGLFCIGLFCMGLFCTDTVLYTIYIIPT